MQPTDDIREVIQRLRVPASPELDRRIHADIAHAAARSPATPSELEMTVWQILRLLMKNKSIRYAVGTVAVSLFVIGLVLNQSTSSAWAIDEAIKALAKYKAVHMMGYTTAGGSPAVAEIWARSDSSGLRSAECLMKSDAFSAWVKDNRTFIYSAAENKVYVDPAVVIGLNPWFGPRFLTTLAKLPNYKAVEGDDPATGQKRIIVTAGFQSSSGPQSFYIEFDGKTKLPVSLKHWISLDRRGAPDFSFEKVVYFEDLSDDTFVFEPPSSVQFTDRPLTIPEPNLYMLADSKSGISSDGMTREQACKKIVGELWEAVIENDYDRIRELCPVVSSWPDGLLRDLGAQDDVIELVDIGGIEKEGQSKLGPLALVSSRVRCRDGKTREVKTIVQFRQADQRTSCVINGNYGYSVEVK